MIVPKGHHRHTGTHEAGDLLHWLTAASWRPIPVEEFARAIETQQFGYETFLPAPHWHWLKDGHRVSNSSARYGCSAWEDAGWRAAALFDLDEVGQQIKRVIGLRCRNCSGVYPATMITTAPPGYDRDASTCAHCHRAAAPVLQGKNRLEVAANVLALPMQLRDARHALANIKRRLPPSNAKALAYEIQQLANALGGQP